MAFQPLDPLLHDVPGCSDLFTADQPGDSDFGASPARALLDWFRKPLVPLTNQGAADEERPRTRLLDAAITAVPEVLGRFPSQHALLAATVMRWTRAVSAPLLTSPPRRARSAFLHALLAAHAEEPALMRLVASTLAASTDGADYYRSAYLQFRETVRAALIEDVRDGRQPATMDPVRGAQQFLALHDGIRLQALLTSDTDVVDAFGCAASRMRRGWAEHYERPAY